MKWKCLILAASLLALCSCQRSRQNQTLPTSHHLAPLWPIQFSFSEGDSIGRILADSIGNIYIVGGTGAYQPSDANLEDTGFDDDCYVAKYDSYGNRLWGMKFGQSGQGDNAWESTQDVILSAALDSHGHLMIVGSTNGDLFGIQKGHGDPSASNGDAFLAKLSPSGAILWERQFGTSSTDAAWSVVVDHQDNIYVVGDTSGSFFSKKKVGDDVFLVKYASGGSLLWGKQFDAPLDPVHGSSEDLGEAIALDRQGNIYIGGMTDHLFGSSYYGSDAFVAKLDPQGRILWGKQFGTEERDEVRSICVDRNGNVYVSGWMNESEYTCFNPQDGFVGKFSVRGKPLWMKQWSTPNGTSISDIMLDAPGNIYAVGGTAGSLFGPSDHLGSEDDGDAAIAKYDPYGHLLWGHQYNVAGALNSIAIDNKENLFIAGVTSGYPFGRSAKGDLFIQRLQIHNPQGVRRQLAPITQPSRLPHGLRPDAFDITPPKKWTAKDRKLAFAWNGRTVPLSFPPLSIDGCPYMYVGYLHFNAGTVIHIGSHGGVLISEQYRQTHLQIHRSTYSIDRQEYRMSGTPILRSGFCYVPLEVMRKLLPLSVSYDPAAKRVCFDPLRMVIR